MAVPFEAGPGEEERDRERELRLQHLSRLGERAGRHSLRPPLLLALHLQVAPSPDQLRRAREPKLPRLQSPDFQRLSRPSLRPRLAPARAPGRASQAASLFPAEPEPEIVPPSRAGPLVSALPSRGRGRDDQQPHKPHRGGVWGDGSDEDVWWVGERRIVASPESGGGRWQRESEDEEAGGSGGQVTQQSFHFSLLLYYFVPSFVLIFLHFAFC